MATQAVTTRTLTTTEAAVLALLAIEGENSGYDLLGFAGKAIGYVWAPARSQLYAVLPRLARDGLAAQQRVGQEKRPDKVLYRITDEGRAALDRWLETVEPGAVESFYLRLFVGRLTSTETLIEHVEQFRRNRGAPRRVPRDRADEHAPGERLLPLLHAPVCDRADRAGARLVGLGARRAAEAGRVSRPFTMTEYVPALTRRYRGRTFARFSHASDDVQERFYAAVGADPPGFEPRLRRSRESFFTLRVDGVAIRSWVERLAAGRNVGCPECR